MALPLILIIIAALGVGAGGATVVYNWDDIYSALRKKKIAVLGERGVGKTTILKYMEKRILIEHYKQTLIKEEIKKTKIKLGDLNISVEKTHDVPGSQDAYGAWKALFDTSDVIFYIVRTNELLNFNPTTEKRCGEDLGQIQGWLKDSKAEKQFFIVGNHWNSDPEFKNLTDETMGNYVDRFRALPVVKTMTRRASESGKVKTVKVALGSLATERDADYLITMIFKQVEQ